MSSSAVARIRKSVILDPGPARPLAVATFASRSGRGPFHTVLPLYLTQALGLSVSRVSLGLTAASVMGLLGGVPAGRLADVRGPRGLRASARVAEALLLCCYALIGDFTEFLAVASLVAFFESVGRSAEGALVAGAIPSEDRVRSPAYLAAARTPSQPRDPRATGAHPRPAPYVTDFTYTDDVRPPAKASTRSSTISTSGTFTKWSVEQTECSLGVFFEP
ncbi:MFS transporter [Streptomyces sp. NBC_01431]